MQTQRDTHYYLGSNSPLGFYSLYNELIDVHSDNTLYILKGGPGCGKSSFMRAIADKMEGLDVEYIHCSGDPDSIDGIYIPSLKTAYVDGTAPHVIEPEFPGASELYIDLGHFYDFPKLRRHKTEIVEINRAYKALYSRAYDCISSANGVMREISAHIVDDSITAAVRKRARGIISREISKSSKTAGKIRRRFLTAFTCRGHVSRFDTVHTLADRVYVIDNDLGLAHILLTDIADAALAAGHDIILCPSPMTPDKTEHIIIPRLKLAFVSTNHCSPFDGKHYRHLRLDAMAENDRMRAYKARIRFSKKIFNLLMQEAEITLSDANKLHNELEAVYNPYVDFDGVYGLAAEHVKMLTNS